MLDDDLEEEELPRKVSVRSSSANPRSRMKIQNVNKETEIDGNTEVEKVETGPSETPATTRVDISTAGKATAHVLKDDTCDIETENTEYDFANTDVTKKEEATTEITNVFQTNESKVTEVREETRQSADQMSALLTYQDEVLEDKLPIISADNIKETVMTTDTMSTDTMSADKLPVLSADKLPVLSTDKLPVLSTDKLPVLSADKLPALSTDKLPSTKTLLPSSLQATEETKSSPAETRVSSCETTDRASASPPCEVSSTTALEEATTATTTVSTPSPSVKLVEGLIAETSEPVVIEEDEDEDEDLGLCIIEDVEEIDDVEPNREMEEEVAESSPVKDNSEQVEEEENDSVVTEKVPAEEAAVEVLPENAPQECQPVDEPVIEEIDDVEPIVDEEDTADNSKNEDIDPMSLLASGVSITVIDKKKREMEEKLDEAAKTRDADVEMVTDISVTMVPKAKGEEKLGKFVIKMKSEKELLDPEKKTFPRRSLTEEDKPSPPDPIVTISKVTAVGPTPRSTPSPGGPRKPAMAPSPGPVSSPGPRPYRGAPPPHHLGPRPHMGPHMVGRGQFPRPPHWGPHDRSPQPTTPPSRTIVRSSFPAVPGRSSGRAAELRGWEVG